MGSGKTLIVSMLGEFQIFYEDQPIILSKFRASKAQELFHILMLHADTGVPKNKLQQSLYDWNQGTDKNDSMNSLVYRLKQNLIGAGLPQGEYVTVKNGICRWISDISIDVDTLKFAKLIQKAEDTEGACKKQILMDALNLYRGELLRGYDGKTWVIEERLRLKRLFEKCVHQLGEILYQDKEYETAFQIYTKAAHLYPFDDWQVDQIDMLQKMERYEDAYLLYKETTQKYFDELGLPPSQRMLDKIQTMGSNILNRVNDIIDIKKALDSNVSERGAYYCTYPSFVDTYRYICRTVERSGSSIFFMVCGVCYLDPQGKRSPKAGDILYGAIESSLRRGDIFARYSNHQYLILLSGTKSENCEMIFQRIRKVFKRKNQNSNCDLEYNISELLEIEEPEEPLKFKKNKNLW